MLRYLAFLWDPDTESQCVAVADLNRRLQLSFPPWQVALEHAGMRVLYLDAQQGSSRRYSLSDGAGVVFGTLFERTPGEDGGITATIATDTTVSPRATARMVASAGRYLIEAYWGRYVAFLQDAVSGKHWVLRDPSGAMPCLTICYRGVTLYSASLEDCHRLGVLDVVSVNWDYIADHLLRHAAHSRATALNEVTEVYPGECIAIDRQRTSRQLYWHPSAFMDAGGLDDPLIASQALKRTADLCIQAWTSSHKRVLHRLSGGLDSAIVLSCLRRASPRPQIVSVNYYSPGGEGDERRYARLAARQANCELIERPWTAGLDLQGLLNLQYSPRPGMYWGWLQHARQEAELAHHTGATAMFGGTGGDQLFYQARTELAAADYLQRHGVNRAFFKVALDAAYCSRQSLWQVLSVAARHGLLRHRVRLSHRTKLTESVLSPLTIERRSYMDQEHPWLRRMQNMPPGKVWQSHALSFPFTPGNPFDEDDPLERIEPLLMSQPLSELCLRIPTYTLTAEGWDRALARRAFARSLPREIIERSSKGGPTDGVRQLLANNLDFIRELLMDGLLARQGILNRMKLEAALSSQVIDRRYGLGEMLKCLCTEAWLRRWCDA